MGTILVLLAAFVAVLLIVQISLSGSTDSPGDKGPLVEQAGSISSESGALPGPGSRPGAAPGSTGASAGSTGNGNEDTPGFPSDAGYAFFISSSATPDSSPDDGGAIPPAEPPVNTGSLSGLVMDATSGITPIPRITIYLAGADGAFTGATTRTGDSGRFLFDGLAPGDYKLYFFDLAGTWKAAWYGAPGNPAGERVSVHSGLGANVSQGMSRVDPEDGSVSGMVTDVAGNGLAGVRVMAYFVDASDGDQLILKGSAVTDAAGNYDIAGLPTSTPGLTGSDAVTASGYKVQFVPPEGIYSSQWFNGQPTDLTAKLLQLKPAEKLGGIDAVLKEDSTVSGGVTLAVEIPSLPEPAPMETGITETVPADPVEEGGGTDVIDEVSEAAEVDEAGQSVEAELPNEEQSASTPRHQQPTLIN